MALLRFVQNLQREGGLSRAQTLLRRIRRGSGGAARIHSAQGSTTDGKATRWSRVVTDTVGQSPFWGGGNGTVPLPSHHHDHGPNQTMQRELTTQKCKHVQNSRFPFQAQKKQGTETSLHWKYDLVCGGSMICLQRCSSETKRCGLFMSQNCDGEKNPKVDCS